MNLSPEKLKLFERIYIEEQEAFRHDKPFPKEFDDEAFIEEYRDWRYDAKEVPLLNEATRVFHELEEKREREEKARQEKAGA